MKTEKIKIEISVESARAFVRHESGGEISEEIRKELKKRRKFVLHLYDLEEGELDGSMSSIGSIIVSGKQVQEIGRAEWTGFDASQFMDELEVLFMKAEREKFA